MCWKQLQETWYEESMGLTNSFKEGCQCVDGNEIEKRKSRSGIFKAGPTNLLSDRWDTS